MFAAAFDCRRGGEVLPASFDCEDAVCAINEAGNLTGLVGDFGLGLMNPVADGTGAGFFVALLPAVEEVAGRTVALGAEMGATGLAGLRSGDLCTVDFDAGALDGTDFGAFVGLVGVFGTAGDFSALEDDLVVVEALVVEIGAGLVVAFAEAVLEVDFVGEDGLIFSVLVAATAAPVCILFFSELPFGFAACAALFTPLPFM